MNIKQIEDEYFMHTYKRGDLVVKETKNQFIWDENGRKYLDFFAGISVCNVGHCNEAVIKAAKKQLDSFSHVSNLYYAPPQIKLGEELVKRTFPGARVFLSNSGAEANECAIKIARKWGFLNPSKEGNRYEIICFFNSFHGRTLTTLSATGQDKFHKFFKPLQEKFVFAEINNMDSVKKLANNRTVAIMIEPVQGEGGIIPSDETFLKELRAFCDDNNFLLIFDEIQCGMGRTGKLYAFENYGIKPDIVTLAKSLANGLPLGASIAGEKCAGTFLCGDHGSTFGGNPVSCAAALAVLNIINSEFLNNSLKIAEYLRIKLENLKDKYSVIKCVRGLGLMIGMDLKINGKDIVNYCMDKGLIINCTNDTVLRLLPPLIITKKDVDFAVKILEGALKWQLTK
ncbi:aspartate aminotransferase family protein [Candidatus Endomicrobiellum trichonymphae]|uniref:Acetylornithine aminotransferase n=1 Tax=Endomicrobium trichonymphae TaxID=1408204 RepID=B1H0L4_ENDTX|nr:aspartate aminotransferase family protein [Candidatus Endomicrobium trichonymphae]BAG14046.1 acetylornithine transaminase [Candidatus Endomicrobium trichonymphae]